MTTAKVKRSSTDTVATARDPRKRLASVARRVTGALGIARSGARMLIERLPGTMDATFAGARDTTSELQRLPDSRLRWLAASSVGLGAGFYFAGAPRLIVAAGLTPALLMGAAIALRPIVPRRWPTSTPMIRLEERPT